MSESETLQVYTDGGCHPNPGQGGWGAVILGLEKDAVELSGAEPDTTNNRMEIMAALEALRFLKAKSSVRIVTDSKYLQNAVTAWLPNWEKNGWKTGSKEPVKNKDLWQALSVELVRHDVTWGWVKGHSGDRWNERADQLASRAMGRVDPADDPDTVHIYGACACSQKAGRGSVAVVLKWKDRTRSVVKDVEDTRSNRLHLLAAIEGLKALTSPKPVCLYTTSDYAKDGASKWIKGWRMNGWRTREGKPVAHKDLWEELSKLQSDIQNIKWCVVDKGELPEEFQKAKCLAEEALEPFKTALKASKPKKSPGD